MRSRFYALLFLAVCTPFFAAVYPELARGATCPTLFLGSTGPAVSTVQKVLYDSYQGFPSPTGYFGKITEAAVKQWQSERKIVSSGNAATTGYDSTGPKTRAAIQAQCR